MLRNVSVCALAFCALLSCSDETSEELLNLNGEVRGKVYLVTEFGQLETEQEGAILSLEEATKKVQTTTDSEGNYVFHPVPTGTYNMVVEKPGYGTILNRGLRVMGGEEPLFGSYTLSRLSTTKVTDLWMEYTVNGVGIRGTVTHNYPSSQFPFVRIIVFLSNSADVSAEKHLSSSSFFLLLPTGSTFSLNVMPDPALFPSGSTVYAVIFGLANSSYTDYNHETKRYEYSGMGTVSSNVASVIIP